MTSPEAAQRPHTLRTAGARYGARPAGGRTSPEDVGGQHALAPPSARYEELRPPETLAASAGGSPPAVADGERLPAGEVLELLALSEVIARKAGYGQQLAVRTAR